MAKRSRTTESTAPKKARTRRPGHFIVKIEGVEQPVVVVATSHKNVVKALLTVTAASPADLMSAGRADYRLIDTTAPCQADLVEVEKLAGLRGTAADIAALGALKADVVRLQRERDVYRQALVEIHDHAADCYDGPEDTVHGRYLEMAGVALGLIP
jgi:hypothetical protein